MHLWLLHLRRLLLLLRLHLLLRLPLLRLTHLDLLHLHPLRLRRGYAHHNNLLVYRLTNLQRLSSKLCHHRKDCNACRL
jgi:hypothetical protein